MRENENIDYNEYPYMNTEFGFKVTRRIPKYKSKKEEQSIRNEQTESCLKIYEMIKKNDNYN